MKKVVGTVAFLLLASCGDGSNTADQKTEIPTPATYILPKRSCLDFTADRGNQGEIVVSGSTNLPQGTKLGVELLNSHGAPKSQDYSVFVTTDDFVLSVFLTTASRSLPDTTRFALSRILMELGSLQRS